MRAQSPRRAELWLERGSTYSTWARARGLALSPAVIALPYYLDTSPSIARRSRQVVAEVLADG